MVELKTENLKDCISCKQALPHPPPCEKCGAPQRWAVATDARGYPVGVQLMHQHAFVTRLCNSGKYQEALEWHLKAKITSQ